MTPDLSHISGFTEFLGSVPPRERSLYALNPSGEHYYLFEPTRKAMELVARLIAGEGLKRTLGGHTLRVCGFVPPLARLVPLISRTSLPVAPDWQFDVAVLSNRTRLIRLDEGVVYTLPNGDPERVRKEIRGREKLPTEITVPELDNYDTEYPYLSEQYITGTHPRSPVDGWPSIRAALEQLTHLYRRDPERVDLSVALSSIEQRLNDRGLLRVSLFERALAMLNRLDLPETVYRATVHRDLHTRNVLVDGDDVYLLDWESCGRDFVFRDFFRPFTIAHYDTRDPDPYTELITGSGHGSRIHREYVDVIGEYAFPVPDRYSGLPIFYLLDTLSRKERSEFWESKRQLLANVVDHESI